MMNKNEIYDVIVIGAGVSGLFFASLLPQKVNGLIFDHSKSPGLKLLMSGAGQCNLTHSGSIKNFVPCYFENGTKVRGCLYKYNNLSMMSFFENNGLSLTTRDDGKVFPKSMNAQDVLNLLLKLSKKNGFNIVSDEVCDITSENSTLSSEAHLLQPIHLIKTDSKIYKCKYLVIASGGCSYPSTGSDGSLFPVLRKLPGITVTPLVPALAPIFVNDYPYSDLSGISFESSHVSLYRNGKKVSEQYGALLLTDRNFSGPCILHISREAKPGDVLSINYLGESFDNSEKKKISKLISESKSKPSTILSSKYKLAKSFAQSLEKRANGKATEIARYIISDEFEVAYPGGFNRAMVTRGGISLNSIKTSTMELKSIPGIYAIGEVLDIDGMTGGYNIQFAYSSASSAANDISKNLNQA